MMRLVRRNHGSERPAAEEPALASIPPAEPLEVEALRVELAELRSSRRRLVDAGDEARRRLERDLHDGTQQRLFQIGLELDRLRRTICDAVDRRVPPDTAVLEQLAETEDHVRLAMSELRELVAGVHPSVLTNRGIDEALRSVTRRSPVPVTVRNSVEERLPESVEACVYFVATEAYHNALRHGHASVVVIDVRREGEALHLEVADDGVGGAQLDAGSGLRGLYERVEALDGTLEVDSPPGGGTRLRVRLPLPAATADER